MSKSPRPARSVAYASNVPSRESAGSVFRPDVEVKRTKFGWGGNSVLRLGTRIASQANSAAINTRSVVAAMGWRLRRSSRRALAEVAEEWWSRMAVRSHARSFVEAYRSSGAFARHRSTIEARFVGVPGAIRAIGSGSSLRIDHNVAEDVSRRKAR